jgi:hypothetical protein
MATSAQYGGMFGPSPEEAAAARQAQIQEYARRDLNLTPMQQAQATFGEVGGMLGDAIGGAMGYENPAVARAKKIQQVTGQYDTSTSSGLLEAARKFNEMGLTSEAQIAAQKGNEMKKQEAATALATRKQDFQENEMFDMKREQMRGNLENKRLQLEQLATYQQGILQNQAASIDQRREAAAALAAIRSEGNQVKLMIAQLSKSGKSDKEQEKIDKAETGRESLGGDLVKAKKLIDELDTSGGITSTAKGTLSNILASLSSSTVGQATGRIVGSEDQTRRDELKSIRLQLLNSIKQATGMGSGQLNSNVELQTWLNSLGSEGMSAEANSAILQNISDKYLKGTTHALVPKPTASPTTPVTSPKVEEKWVRGADGKLKRSQ